MSVINFPHISGQFTRERRVFEKEIKDLRELLAKLRKYKKTI